MAGEEQVWGWGEIRSFVSEIVLKYSRSVVEEADGATT